ncbi:hypothetical protein ICN10_00125 [Polynucleobacter sp. 86C-FISCH]|uniref:hypothetical protein n=1 Tax=Polynucleobacter sp. 86C-FISCH TaxID=2689101 RepID=UPI001C0DAEB9|nr:hypothetical protein [Polynucleobacter sp. 86C-FISCH]MBU3594805.1 hypothetical protein [Polynucleobacter sp. 86C-FISCH]
MKNSEAIFLALSIIFFCSPANSQGNAQTIAEREINKAEHPCGKVVSAAWKSDGGIYAVCSNKEDYLIGSMQSPKGVVMYAMKCSALPLIGMPRSSCKK